MSQIQTYGMGYLPEGENSVQNQFSQKRHTFIPDPEITVLL